ncbi:hypothetical protein PVAG01_09559 [Phlyctema vagabunda]|uniref:Heterokaryon incompatibility domain-containing protein n=1 Tax=Phlyctema vagabunda TaxID=108571 RepID=A0ABR4P7V4_9HELO
MTNRIDFDELPKTFREAICFARNLEIEYLWIDSLYIIQDSIQDWEDESAQMGSVYRNALLAQPCRVKRSNGLYDLDTGAWKDVLHSASKIYPHGFPSKEGLYLNPVLTQYPKQLPVEQGEASDNQKPSLNTSPREGLDIWGSAIAEYSKCSSTVEKDKRVAISGLAKHIQPLLDGFRGTSRYLAGIWEPSLPQQLL